MLHHELRRRLCLARDLLRECGESRLSVNEIARRIGIAPHYFIRLFRAVFGDTPHQYRTNAQIEHAKHLLLLSDASVTEICMAVGFSSLGSFSALFSERVGIPPSVFRRRHRRPENPPRQLPPEMIPGCFSLMALLPAHKGNFEEAGVPRMR